MSIHLGIPQLWVEWKRLFSWKYLAEDVSAGITVAFVAIPLSLAIALASGVSPATGLITAVVAGIVCALFGGTPLAVSGPAAAMAVLLAVTVEKYGFNTLVFICLIAGAMQLLSGMLGLGRLGRYVPLPVIAGFTAGIGFIILVGQLPRAFGLMPPPESHVFEVFSHIKEYFHDINVACLGLVILTILIIRGLPKIFPKIPPILPAVALATFIVYYWGLDVPLIGEIPRTLPAPQLPSLPQIPFTELMLSSFAVYLLASLETLLSCSAIDKLSNSKKHDANQELIGQGLGNIAVSLFGGMPVTGVIARSATNVKAGAKTRRASIIHSLVVLLTVFAIAPIISYVPIVALAGVLLSVAFSMLKYKDFYDLWVTSRSEAFIYALTFFVIIFVDLIAGVEVGMIAAAVLVLLQVAETRLHVFFGANGDVVRLSLTGALTFLSIGKINQLEKKLMVAQPGQTVLLDLSNITNLDTSAASAIVDLFKLCKQRQLGFYIRGLSRRFECLFTSTDAQDLITHHYIISEHELKKKSSHYVAHSSYDRLLHGVQRFYAEIKHNDKRLFDYIARRQSPHTLFITCSDSRIMPSLITSSEPGELFIIRNVGNYIPVYQANSSHSETAALEFALTQLEITDIVICGHANCGAMQACIGHHHDAVHSTKPSALSTWIGMIESQLSLLPATSLNEVAKQNVLNQIENLKTHPVVEKKLNEKTLLLHAWFFDFDENRVHAWDEASGQFQSLIPTDYSHFGSPTLVRV